MSPYLTINKKQFEKVIKYCRRWSERSKNVAQLLLVNGVPISEVAKKHDMSTQQAHVIRSRFIKKMEEARLQEFMDKEQPKLSESLLEPFHKDLNLLREKGYTIKQMVNFLKDNDVVVSTKTVSNFFKGKSE